MKTSTRSLIISLILIPILSSVAFAYVNPPLLQPILDKIEKRRNGWIAFESKVSLTFLSQNERKGTCEGSLIYHRLDEKLLLQCHEPNGKLAFILKTSDFHFSLYLPMQKTLVEGNIFDLAGSRDIDSFLKARDLYRALKPEVLLKRNTKLVGHEENKTTLEVYGNHLGHGWLKRKMKVNREGDILEEVFYARDKTPITRIKRSSFKKIKTPNLATSRYVFFPKEIEISEEKTGQSSHLLFKDLVFLPNIPSASWEVNIPKDTKVQKL